jgi:hypothetical protein
MSKKSTKWVYVLKTVDKDMQGYGGFKYPTKGKVTAPDWQPTKQCGKGLHALLWAEGGDYLSTDITAKWLVLKVDKNLMVSFSDKVKFKEGFVCYAGNCDGAIAYIKSKMPLSILNTVYGTAGATGTKGTASATGYHGTASATGDCGTASATGYQGTASATGKGSIILSWYDEKADRLRLVVGYPGENGLKSKTLYTLDEKHNFVEVKKESN